MFLALIRISCKILAEIHQETFNLDLPIQHSLAILLFSLVSLQSLQKRHCDCKQFKITIKTLPIFTINSVKGMCQFIFFQIQKLIVMLEYQAMTLSLSFTDQARHTSMHPSDSPKYYMKEIMIILSGISCSFLLSSTDVLHYRLLFPPCLTLTEAMCDDPSNNKTNSNKCLCYSAKIGAGQDVRHTFILNMMLSIYICPSDNYA